MPAVIVDTGADPIAPGKLQPTRQSPEQGQMPEWLRDTKSGIWAHWGPQCQPEAGDWYLLARSNRAAARIVTRDPPSLPAHAKKRPSCRSCINGR